MRESPAVLQISRWLESQAGHRKAYGLVSMSPVCALTLDLTNHPEMAIRVIAVGIVILVSVIAVVFWVCGRSLMRGIHVSIRLQQNVFITKTKGGPGKGSDDLSNVEQDLMAARRKVKAMIAFALFSCGNVGGLLLFAVCSKYGTQTPLLLFATPMALVPPIWNSVNIQLHGGRSKIGNPWVLSSDSLSMRVPIVARLSGTARRLSATSSLLSGSAIRLSMSTSRWNARNQVIPTDLPASSSLPC